MNNSFKRFLLMLACALIVEHETVWSQKQTANDGQIEMFVRVEAQNDSLNAASKTLRIYKEPNLTTPFSQTVSREIFVWSCNCQYFSNYPPYLPRQGSTVNAGSGISDHAANPDSGTAGIFFPPLDTGNWYRLRIVDTVGAQIFDRYVRFYVTFDSSFMTPPPSEYQADWTFIYRNQQFLLVDNQRPVIVDTVGGMTKNWNSPIRVTQILQTGDTLFGSSVDRWENSQFQSYLVPATLMSTLGTEVLRASRHVLFSQKYRNWFYFDAVSSSNSLVEVNLLENHNLFRVAADEELNKFTAQFNPTHTGVVIKNELIDAPEASWSEIAFRDPWFADTTDQYGKRNRGAVEARFWSRPSPFSPDAATLYNGEAYKGVFLNQGYNAQLPNNPYYAIRTQDNLAVGGSTARFLGWSASGASLVQEQGVSDTLRKAVVFQSPTATVKAIYKGRLLSSLANATSAGNQRRLANAQGATLYNNVFYLVYESAGKIWLTYTTNGGTSWTNEQYLGDGKNPTVAASSGTALIAWNTGTGQLACRQFIYDPLSSSLSPTLPIPYGNRVTPDAKVIIALPPNHQSTLQATLLCEVSVLNNPSQTRLGGVRVSFSGSNGTISSSYDILNSPIFSSPNASMDIAAVQEDATFGNKIYLVHTNYGNGAPYPVYYATVNTSGSLTYTPVLQMTDNVFATWQPKNLTITLDSLNNKHLAWDAFQSALNTQVLIYRSISASNQSVSPSTRLYSQNGGYRKPSLNFFNGTVSLVWQTDDGWTAFGSRQLNNSNWYSFGFQQGWSSANTTIRGGKRFVAFKRNLLL